MRGASLLGEPVRARGASSSTVFVTSCPWVWSFRWLMTLVFLRLPTRLILIRVSTSYMCFANMMHQGHVWILCITVHIPGVWALYLCHRLWYTCRDAQPYIVDGGVGPLGILVDPVCTSSPPAFLTRLVLVLQPRLHISIRYRDGRHVVCLPTFGP